MIALPPHLSDHYVCICVSLSLSSCCVSKLPSPSLLGQIVLSFMSKSQHLSPGELSCVRSYFARFFFTLSGCFAVLIVFPLPDCFIMQRPGLYRRVWTLANVMDPDFWDLYCLCIHVPRCKMCICAHHVTLKSVLLLLARTLPENDGTADVQSLWYIMWMGTAQQQFHFKLCEVYLTSNIPKKQVILA